MSDDEFDRCMAVLNAIHPHHNWRHYASRKGITRGEWSVEVVCRGDMATYDGDELTRLVVAAHQRLVRVGISAHCRGYLRLLLSPRQESGYWHERHPGIDRLAVGATA